jgi:hypothetical protein
LEKLFEEKLLADTEPFSKKTSNEVEGPELDDPSLDRSMLPRD